ncbi:MULTISPECIES: ParB/Srx family N-terminal domain-containing protein [Prochlorococcus]|uniref:ParB/Srx family N-terminal domain-containing protein n=1 Tax=Prochlorococcus TaxID=1218 RepID=UPI000533B398|nr:MULTISPECIES: ParB/Srx family N-terminal domain-containing protein [Prochlorococcus]KGG12822.1 hypothetical protein EV05_0494 [Prochlorococcus sp. MIT 0601]
MKSNLFGQSKYEEIPKASSRNNYLKVKINSLLPTQMCIGLAEVINRKVDFLKESKEARLNYIKTKPVPLVSNSYGSFWMLDRHHRLRALLEIEKDAEVYGYVVKEIKTKEDSKILEFLESRGWLYLYNSRGVGPQPIQNLPKSLLSLEDDPYRSLVWQLKQEGVLTSHPLVPYYEFKWASWLRRMPLPPFTSQKLSPALPQARKLMTSQNSSTFERLLK